MSQITTGIRSILSHPTVYDIFQNIMGAQRIRKEFADNSIRAIATDKVLDIGCGTAEILDFLPNVEYWGFDISDEYINAAKKRFGQRGNFKCELFTTEEVSILPKFNIAVAIGVLHHLDDSDALNLMKLIHSSLLPGGRLITLDPCYSPNQNPIAKFLIDRDRGENVRNTNGYKGLADANFNTVSAHVIHRNWIPYTHCIMESTK